MNSIRECLGSLKTPNINIPCTKNLIIEDVKDKLIELNRSHNEKISKNVALIEKSVSVLERLNAVGINGTGANNQAERCNVPKIKNIEILNSKVKFWFINL